MVNESLYPRKRKNDPVCATDLSPNSGSGMMIPSTDSGLGVMIQGSLMHSTDSGSGTVILREHRADSEIDSELGATKEPRALCLLTGRP
jgi:hypothetical protein